MRSWNEIGHAWSIFRELNVDEIRAESEQTLTLACAGQSWLIETLSDLLTQQKDYRYGSVGTHPIRQLTLPLNLTRSDIHQADMLLLVIDGRHPITQPYIEAYKQLDALALPLVLVVLHNDRFPDTEPDQMLSLSSTTRIITIANPRAPDAADKLASSLLRHMPAELHIAAARTLPGIRNSMASELIQTTSFSNATYALIAGIPEQIPFLQLPLMAADILVLTKNQALMTYKLALAHGAPADFRAHLAEIIPVIGGGFLWRQLARTLVSLVPVWGLIPRVTIAYAGTYTTGMLAWRWYASGELISKEQIQQLTEESVQYGRALTIKLLEEMQERGLETQAFIQQLFQRSNRSASPDHPPALLNPPE